MAALEKFTDASVMMLLKHCERQLKNDSNKEIVTEKKDLNYSFDIERGGLSPKQFYKSIKDNSYLYGRGTKREAEAITCCSWVITLPKAVSDYSSIEKDDVKVLNPEEEKSFFEGVFKFVSDRYGTVFYNRIHYDEGGQPHIHIYFIPQTKLDHDLVHYKTTKTHHAVKTESGRYEYTYRFKMENGEKIPLKNYAKMSDYYDTKISGADVLNKAELQHFHSDLSEYLKKHNIPGANAISSGRTAGKNVCIKALKSFTKATGITLDYLQENPFTIEDLSILLDNANLTSSERKTIKTINSEALIEKLQFMTHQYEYELQKTNTSYIELEKKYEEITAVLENTRSELEITKTQLEELEKQKSYEIIQQQDNSQGWGTNSAEWGEKTQSDWGRNITSADKEYKW